MNMANVKPHGSFVALEGLDGSGKSTVGHEVARKLSDNYREVCLKITDSDGLYTYRGGEVVTCQYKSIEGAEPHSQHGGTETLLRLGAFTMARRFIDHPGLRSDLLIGVRDPHRITPAVYCPIFFPGLFGRLSPETRLKALDIGATVRVPDAVVALQADVSVLIENMRDRSIVDTHEDKAHMTGLQIEMPRVLHAFTAQFDCPVYEVNALQSSTTEAVITQLEPFIDTQFQVGGFYSRAA